HYSFAFHPAAPFDAFTFAVQDSGGTASGGSDTDPAPKTVTINVTAANNAPQTQSASVTIAPLATYTFATTDFSFDDYYDRPPLGTGPANALLAVQITQVPTTGALTFNSGTSDVAVTAGQFVSAADI